MTRQAAQLAEETIAADEEDVTGRFIAFIKAATERRYPTGIRRRFNQARHTACVAAEFTVLDDLPMELRVGLFASPRSYAATIRFANASSQTDREPDIRGMSMSLSGVIGENLTAGATTQDFVLNSHPVMMAPDTAGFLELLQANEAGGGRRALYFLTHPKAARIAFGARAQPNCHLDIPYWSTTPYAFGPGRAVKYVVLPTSSRKSPAPAQRTDTYLRDAMQAHLAAADATFDFAVQFQTDAQRMPIEDATVEWKERDSPYRRVAQIRIPKQPLAADAASSRCEQMAFNPWHCLAEHRPLGGMNRARRRIYEEMAAFRAAAAPTA